MTKPAVILLALLLCACSHKDSEMPSSADMKAVRANLAFTCIHEADHLPPLGLEANGLFVYGRYLETSDGPKDFNAIARYYRIAAAYGHYKANHNLQLLVSEGSASSPDPEKETIDLAEQLIKAGVPGGYYDMGHYLELGYGVKRDEDKARRYFRKAADLGSPEAQAYVGNLLAPRDKAPTIARQMRQCATDQGYGVAANTLGVDLQTDKLFPEAVKVFQRGVQSGNALSALALEEGFKGPLATDQLNYLALPQDPERAKRYRTIQLFLRANEGRNPKLPDIDNIVPLPPAKLPPWDGTFQWENEQAAVLPEKPSDELVDRMAKEKHLDPATGLPLHNASAKSAEAIEPSSKAQTANVTGRWPIGTVAYSGDACPEDGVWCANLAAGQLNGAQRRFVKGETLPTLIVQAPRRFDLLDRWRERREHPERVIWQLTAYPEQA